VIGSGAVLMAKPDVPDKAFHFVGGYLFLDFINTQIAVDGQPVNLLEDFDDLIDWSEKAGIIDSSQAKTLSKPSPTGRKVKEAFGEALELRQALRRMVERIIDKHSVDDSTIELINQVQRNHRSYEELTRSGNGFKKLFRRVVNKPSQLLSAVAESATDLLCNGDLSLIRKCENPTCVLYFYDNTKNHARRWCSMNSCGNRMKVAAYYKRTRQAESE